MSSVRSCCYLPSCSRTDKHVDVRFFVKRVMNTAINATAMCVAIKMVNVTDNNWGGSIWFVPRTRVVTKAFDHLLFGVTWAIDSSPVSTIIISG